MQRSRFTHFTISMSMIVAIWSSGARLTADDAPEQSDSKAETLLRQGREIYAARCASCHGEAGQGVDQAYAEPLSGDLSVGELAKQIAETMPEGEPEKCLGDDARAVAAFIHHEFYSEAARVRNRPPRILLTHLTSEQLRQSLSDLYARFSGIMWTEEKRGIEGIYFNGARWRNENKKIERTDARIDFDWNHDGPGAGIDPQDFFVRWRGGLKVDETGTYEIVIRSTCAFICKLGGYERDFINNRVQSGDQTEFRKSIVLTAGRVYPLQIELFQRKRKTEQPPARISLAWVPPGGMEGLIPERNLLPVSAPATFSLQANLPPDDRSYGYERGLAVDRQWDAAVTTAAVEFSQAAVDELWPQYRKRNRDSDENRGRLRRFLADLAATAFRGPLDDASREFYIDAQVDQTEDDAEAIKRSLLVVLKSPRFLYPGLDHDRSASRRAANRLALTLFDSLPADEWLLKLAADDKLESADQIRAAAERMIGDERARAKVRGLIHAWLNLDHFGEITKNSERFPEFTPEIAADARDSLNAFVDDVVWGESSDFRQFFLADWSYTTPRLEQFYGADWKPAAESAAEFSRSVAAAERRGGVLTHPYMMSGLAYQDSTSPIHRGVFLIRYLLGRTLRPPQEAFTPLSPDLHPDMTTRERVHLQTSPAACQVCHIKINGLGFVLENFDAVGRFRKEEAGKPIDSGGEYIARDGTAVNFEGPLQLAQFLANSHDTHRAFVQRAFQHLVKQPTAAYGASRLEELTETFRRSDFHIRKLLVEIAVTAATQIAHSSEEGPAT